jgi:transcriptional regulator with XRE-family HTH domain
MNKLGENLKQLLQQAKLSENELSRRTGIPQQIINRMISGKNINPKLETIKPIASYFTISISQLIGEGNLSKEIKLSTDHLGWTEVPLLNFLNNNLLSLGEVASTTSNKVKIDTPVSADGFAVQMFDDSMEPRFPKGTLLVFDATRKLKSGKFYLIYSKILADKYRFRQILIKNSAKLVRCLNPKSNCYEAKLLQSTDIIMGVLVQARINF